MKWIRSITVVTVFTSMVLQSTAAIDKPVALDDALLSVTISDVHGFIDEAGVVAAQVSPMISGYMIKGMLGAQLGDPGLAGIPVGDGLSVVALDMTNIFAVVEVSAAQSAAYVTSLQMKGLQAQYVGDVVVIAMSPEILSAGAAVSGRVKSTLLADSSAALKLVAQPGFAIEQFDSEIDEFIESLPSLMYQGMMQQQGATLESVELAATVIEAEVLVLRSLIEQSELVEVALTPKDGGILMSQALLAKDGTPLDAMINAPVTSKVNESIQSKFLGDAAIKYDFHIANMDSIVTFFAQEAEKVMQQMEVDDVDVASVVDTVQKWIGCYGGTGCETIGFGTDGQMEMRYVIEVTDEAAALATLKNASVEIQPLLKLYEKAEVKMAVEFRENVREAAGVSIHQFVVNMDVSAMSAEQQEQFNAMGGGNAEYDVAITDGKMFFSQPGDVEALIQAVATGQSSSSMQARTDYPADGFYYMDIDMNEYMRFIMMSIPDDPQAAMAKQVMASMFEGVPPITSAGFMGDSCLRMSTKLSGELFAKIGQMVMQQQMQKMQQAGATPGQ